MPSEGRGELAGRVAFVTGAASGIGRITALAFAGEGADVVVADIDQHGNQGTATMVEDRGGQVLAVKCDVTRGEDVQAALAKDRREVRAPRHRLRQRGAEQQPNLTADTTEAEWDRIITINLRSVFCA